MNKKKIYLGYKAGLIKGNDLSCNHDKEIYSDRHCQMYTELLPVLYDNKEFLKTVYPQYIFRNYIMV